MPGPQPNLPPPRSIVEDILEAVNSPEGQDFLNSLAFVPGIGVGAKGMKMLPKSQLKKFVSMADRPIKPRPEFSIKSTRSITHGGNRGGMIPKGGTDAVDVYIENQATFDLDEIVALVKDYGTQAGELAESTLVPLRAYLSKYRPLLSAEEQKLADYTVKRLSTLFASAKK